MQNEEYKIAIVAVVIKNKESVEKVNAIFHTYGEFVIGRMGIPYKQKAVNLISIAIDAPQTVLNSLSGKLGMLDGVSSKVLITK
jgi:putative iron-only hydrogenase system regulator